MPPRGASPPTTATSSMRVSMNHRKRLSLLLASSVCFAASAAGQAFSIDFAADEPNQLINAPLGISITAVEVSAGSISYVSFGTTFDGVPAAQSSGGWMASTDPLEARNFFFTITADPGLEFSLDGVSSLVRSTGAGPAGAALIVDGEAIDSVSMPDEATPILSVAGAATGFFTTVTVRIAGYDDGSRASTGGGAFRIGGIEGDLTVIPEPSVYGALFGGVALLLAWRLRRRR